MFAISHRDVLTSGRVIKVIATCGQAHLAFIIRCKRNDRAGYRLIA